MLVYNVMALTAILLGKLCKKRIIYLTYMYAFMTFVAGARDFSVGTDTYTYAYIYSWLKYDEFSIYNIYNPANKIEIGELIIAKLSRIIYDSPQTYIILMSTLTLILIAIFIYREAGKYYDIATFTIITMGFYFYMMNVERQALAIAVSCIAISYIIRGKYLKGLLIATASILFHFSLIIVIPVFAVISLLACKLRTRYKFIIISSFIVLVALFLFYEFNNTNIFGSRIYYFTSTKYGVLSSPGIYFYSIMLLNFIIPILLNTLPAPKRYRRNKLIISGLILVAFALQVVQVNFIYIIYRFVDTFSIYLCIAIPYILYSFKDCTEKKP